MLTIGTVHNPSFDLDCVSSGDWSIEGYGKIDVDCCPVDANESADVEIESTSINSGINKSFDVIEGKGKHAIKRR